MTLRDFEEQLKNSYNNGLSNGKAQLIAYFHLMIQGIMRPEHWEQDGMDDATWKKAQAVMNRLSGSGH